MDSMMSMVNGMSSLFKPDSPSDESTKAKGDDPKVISIAWDIDWTGFIVGTDRGFNVYSCNPIKENIKHDSFESGFKIAEMLYGSNLFALVGNGDNSSKYPPNKACIWDEKESSCTDEHFFDSEVIAMKLMEDYTIVVFRKKICVYPFANFHFHRTIDTGVNPKGLCCVSHDMTNQNNVLACPGIYPGQVRVHDLKKNKTKFVIKAHDSAIGCMTLTLDGSLLATASTKGTLIRIFKALDGTLLQELRRGIERAEIYSIAISSNLKWVAVSSDKGTLHVFRLRPKILSVPPNIEPPSSSSFTSIKGMLPKYLTESERSFAQFSLPVSTKFILGFGLEDTVLIVGIDGRFVEEGGKMVELEHKRFFSLPKTDDELVVVET